MPLKSFEAKFQLCKRDTGAEVCTISSSRLSSAGRADCAAKGGGEATSSAGGGDGARGDAQEAQTEDLVPFHPRQDCQGQHWKFENITLLYLFSIFHTFFAK